MIQCMFDELAPQLDPAQRRGLLKRLGHNYDPDQTIPAEYELSLTWAASRMAKIEVEREFGRGRPDIYFYDFGPQPAAIEIVTVSDHALGGAALMDRAANIIAASALRYRKDAPNHLHFEFLEESFYEEPGRSSRQRRFVRRRRVTREFCADDMLDVQLRQWLGNGAPMKPLRFESDHIGVIISWRDYVHPHARTFSSMPPVCYDLRENPLYEALKNKARRQLRDVPEGTLKGIFATAGRACCAT